MSRICTLMVFAMFSVSDIAPAAEHGVGANFTLKLEYEMSRQGGSRASAEQLSPAVLFSITELSDRVTAADNRVQAVEQDNQKWKAELSARESLIGELERALGAQDQTIKLLENEAVQVPQPAARLPQPEGRTWGPAGWNPSELRWEDFRDFARFPTAAERTLTVALMLLLLYALYLRLRSHDTPPALDGNRVTPQAQRGTPTPSQRRNEAGPRPIAAEQQMYINLSELDMSAQQQPLEYEPPSSKARPEPREPQETAPPTITLAPGDLMQQPTPAPGMSMHQENQPTPSSRPKRKRADQATLREVDALIAFEHFDDASEVLAQAMSDNPDNPEYRLRSLYILNALGDHERVASEQSVLRAIMDGPMSDTLGRVIETGRGLLPGDPLFESNDPAPSPTPQPPLHADDAITLDNDSIDDFNESTFGLDDIEFNDEPPKTD